MKIYLIFLFSAFCCFADWAPDDSTKLTDIRNTLYDVYSEQYKFQNGYYSNEPAGRALGWKEFYMESFKAQRELSDAKEYAFRRVDGHDTTTLVEQNPYSEGNQTMFSQNDYMQDNTDYYRNSILYYFNDSEVVSNLRIPDSDFINNPVEGDNFYKMIGPLNNANLGINAIKNSEQTAPIRNKIIEDELRLTGMFSNNYESSVINWDLSSLGQVFVDKGLMLSNPWANLRGSFRIVPVSGDFHYSIWYGYFRDSSTVGHAFRLSVRCLFYGFLLVTVLNDIMAIVNA